MTVMDVFARGLPAPVNRATLAVVVDVADPQAQARVKIEYLNHDSPADGGTEVWARVAVAFAGDGYGAFALPRTGETVLVTFIDDDPRAPVVVGSLWHGGAAPSEPVPTREVERWTLSGPAGTRIAIEEPGAGRETVAVTTPGGVRLEITDAGGGKVEIVQASNRLTLDAGGVAVRAAATVSVEAAQVEVKAAMVDVSAGMSRFSGLVQCDTLVANAVVATSYTPGAGNVW